MPDPPDSHAIIDIPDVEPPPDAHVIDMAAVEGHLSELENQFPANTEYQNAVRVFGTTRRPG